VEYRHRSQLIFQSFLDGNDMFAIGNANVVMAAVQASGQEF
jgi:hypothetical protein